LGASRPQSVIRRALPAACPLPYPLPQDSESAALADLAALTRRLQAALPPGPVLQRYPEPHGPDGQDSQGQPGAGGQEPMRSLEQLFAQAACADLFLRDKVPQRPPPRRCGGGAKAGAPCCTRADAGGGRLARHEARHGAEGRACWGELINGFGWQEGWGEGELANLMAA
jgi:hypothetical protein